MRLGAPAVAFLLVAVAVACSSSRDARVGAAALSPNGMTLELYPDTCNADLSIRVEETDREVRVLVTARNDENGDCGDHRKITLSEPLGDRLLIDESDGEPVKIFRSRSPDAQ